LLPPCGFYYLHNVTLHNAIIARKERSNKRLGGR
jgi:hypothetical protein